MNPSTKTNHLQVISRINDKIESCTLQIHDIPEDDPDIVDISTILGKITPVQVVLWTVIFLQNIENHRPSMVDLARNLHIKTIDALTLLPELDILRKKKLLRFLKPRRTECRTSISFIVPTMIMDTIIYGVARKEQKNTPKDVFSLLGMIQNLFEEVDERFITHDELIIRLTEALQHYSDLDYVKTINSLKHLSQEEILLILHLSIYTLHGSSVELDQLMNEVTSEAHLSMRLKKSIMRESSPLIKDKIIKLESDHFRSEGRVVLTDPFIDKLFGIDADLVKQKTIDKTSLIKAEGIPEIELLFNDNFTQKLDVIYNCLLPDTFNRIQSQLSADNQAKGICILFSGLPGTGKTQSVYNIAKKTGRSIYPVQVTDFKSPYHGESESNLKAVFDKYNLLVKNSKIAPILLLNEADAILSTRVTVKRSIDQTMNSIQNMLLEFFERNDGIIICTLNNASNLDKAFSRRFLMKINFEKPDNTTKARIWKVKLPRLSDDDAMYLAETFDMTGGEMDNIVRKATIQKMIYQQKITLSDLEKFCQEEKMDNDNRTKVGYRK